MGSAWKKLGVVFVICCYQKSSFWEEIKGIIGCDLLFCIFSLNFFFSSCIFEGSGFWTAQRAYFQGTKRSLGTLLLAGLVTSGWAPTALQTVRVFSAPSHLRPCGQPSVDSEVQIHPWGSSSLPRSALNTPNKHLSSSSEEGIVFEVVQLRYDTYSKLLFI